jgi:hypothetical protein
VGPCRRSEQGLQDEQLLLSPRNRRTAALPYKQSPGPSNPGKAMLVPATTADGNDSITLDQVVLGSPGWGYKPDYYASRIEIMTGPFRALVCMLLT